jgi:putative DNA primase/helicase
MGGDKELIYFLQRAWGSCLSGDTRDRKIFIMWGSGANGKSICNDTISMMLGEYAMRTPVDTLLVKRGDNIPNDLARLKGARFVYASEADQKRRLSEGLVKDVTGGEKIAARFMRGEWFEFRPEFKVWLGTNHKPVITGTDNAIWDRIALIPFTVRIPDEKQRPRDEILKEFEKEGPGILAWLVRGCFEWFHDGLQPPAKVTKATSEYRDEMDVLKQFIIDRCVIGDDLKCTVKELYTEYCNWCESEGEKPIAKNVFTSSLEERGFKQCYVNRQRGRKGIGLLPSDR